MADYLIDVEPTGYVDAASATKGLLSTLRSAAQTALGSLSSTHGMAGSDDAGQTWATSYDSAARSVLTDTAALLTAFDSIAVGLHVTGYNHAVAETHASNGTVSTSVSQPASAVVETLGTPPSSHGGNRDFPWGFDYVSDLIGMAWPDGDAGKLRSAAQAWSSFASDLAGIDATGPLAHVSGFTSPEISGIEQRFQSARTVVSGLAEQARAIAAGSRARADAIEKAHHDTEAELVKLAAMIAGTVVASALLTPFTLGISDAVGAGAVTAETTVSVGRIVMWLTEAVESTIAAAGTVAEAVTGVGGLSAAIEALAVRVAPMVVVYGAQGIVSGGSSAVVDGVVNGTTATIGEDMLFGMLLPEGGGLAASASKTVGKTVLVDGTERVVEGRLPAIVAKRFTVKADHDVVEFDRQLRNQQDGMNSLTVGDFLRNRNAYLADGRDAAAHVAQKGLRARALDAKIEEIAELEPGLSYEQIEEKAAQWMSTKAALHNPDLIAGGHAKNVADLGDNRINSSLGSQWRTRIKPLDRAIRKQAEGMTEAQMDSTYLNVRLVR